MLTRDVESELPRSGRGEAGGRVRPRLDAGAAARASIAEIARAGGRSAPLFIVGDDATARALDTAGYDAIDGEVPIVRVRVTSAAASDVRTLHGLAARLVAQLRPFAPSAYRLVGVGAAGALAYEMGLQLLGDDQPVELLAAVDAEDASASAAWEAWSREYHAHPAPLDLHVISGASRTTTRRPWYAALPRERVRAVTAPTGGSIAAAIATSLRDAEHAARAHARETAHASSAVTIQGGARGSAPFFCVPGAGASVTDFVPLAIALGDACDVIAFEARGMDPTLVPRTTVRAASIAYVRELCALQPRGPVHLVGHSFGGWIAFDMALRLGALGREVGSLVIVDSDVPEGDDDLGREHTRVDALLSLVQLYEWAAERSIGVTRAELESHDHDGQLALLHAHLIAIGLAPKRSSASMLRGPTRSFEAALRSPYRPSATFDGIVRLVQVPTPTERADEAARRFEREVVGWRRFAPRLEARIGTGNHVTVLKAPYVADWARWMQVKHVG